MSIYAVIDTNVLLSALLSKKSDTATVKLVKALMDGKFVPLWHESIIEEYDEVFHRPKFHLQESSIQKVLTAVQFYGKYTKPITTADIPSDADDVIFWQIVMAEHYNDAFLVTGNIKHFPQCEFVVTPATMVTIHRW